MPRGLSVLTPQRHIELEGAYETQDGRQTRWRPYLRSAGLDGLTPESQQALVGSGIRTVIDLRMPEELERGPDVFSEFARVVYHRRDLAGEESIRMVGAQSPTVLGPYIGRWTRKMILHIFDHRRLRICGTLATLVEPGGLPAIVHCSEGKGRTGLIIAMMLGLAGVPAETIAEEYAQTAEVRWRSRSRKPRSPRADVGDITWEEYLNVCSPPSATYKTLELLDRRYGGIEEYVRDGGLTEDQVCTIRGACRMTKPPVRRWF